MMNMDLNVQYNDRLLLIDVTTTKSNCISHGLVTSFGFDDKYFLGVAGAQAHMTSFPLLY